MFRLMIADDEDAERMGIRFLLHKFGYTFEIREAPDGMEALKGLGEFPADILVTDVKMPFLNGIELAAKVREQFPQTQSQSAWYTLSGSRAVPCRIPVSAYHRIPGLKAAQSHSFSKKLHFG